MRRLRLTKESLAPLDAATLHAVVGGVTTNCTLYCTLDFDACMPSNTHACTNSC